VSPGFEQEDAAPRLGEPRRERPAAGAGSDNDIIELVIHRHSLSLLNRLVGRSAPGRASRPCPLLFPQRIYKQEVCAIAEPGAARNIRVPYPHGVLIAY